MRCPQCDADAPEDAWNCPSCRINLYWATQHYDVLAQLRERRGLPGGASSPAFLLASHKQAMAEREARGAPRESKVRAVARKVMRRGAVRPGSAA